MKITSVKSRILSYDLDEELGYSQQYYNRRTAHLVEVRTDDGLVGWGECFGAGNFALGNKAIVEQVLAPLFIGQDPLDREVLWHRAYKMMRDHGQKGMPLESLSGIDIALWDIAGKAAGLPLHKLLGGAFRTELPVYGYGMMLKRGEDLPQRFHDEALELKDRGYAGLKMKVGIGPREDIKLVEAVRDALGPDGMLMVDANHAYTATEAFVVGKALGDLNVEWFEEPVAPEDRDGYRFLTSKLDVKIAGGEVEFSRWGWRDLLEGRGVDIAQPEVCAVGGVSEYLKVLTLAHTNFIPVINHVWGSGIAIATNLHLLAAMPDLPGAMSAVQPMLECDTTPHLFQDEILTEPLDVHGQVARRGTARVPDKPGIGVEIDLDAIKRFEIS
ncbi:mandelate racemase [Leucobacter sp. UCD-THU]|uniref:mandelate racemase/muconate lactonizing enzyme family protein n=1 Tax=Leucobacter sp. UCD-THU TaxID=1292023 RepID=UPI000363E1DE|nr:mandelate racemase/muconate lactonizing enzyme family protein [Leucobacter sp. UCD-THU]EYT56598.1 mandelate racemase [Leucobacter sp. UCD-THU]